MSLNSSSLVTYPECPDINIMGRNGRRTLYNWLSVHPVSSPLALNMDLVSCRRDSTLYPFRLTDAN